MVHANVLSESAKPTPDPRVVAWLRAHERDIAVDPVILGELRFGILILCLPWDADTGLKRKGRSGAAPNGKEHAIFVAPERVRFARVL